jgi:hypothetical protein
MIGSILLAGVACLVGCPKPRKSEAIVAWKAIRGCTDHALHGSPGGKGCTRKAEEARETLKISVES